METRWIAAPDISYYIRYRILKTLIQAFATGEEMKPLKIADFEIGENTPPFIIAEIGNNHDGDRTQALRLIAAAAKSGADAVKFQTYTPELLVRPEHELYEFFSRFALPREWHKDLQTEAAAQGIVFLSTPFDLESADFLVSLGVPALKIASSDLTNLELVRHCASSGLPLLLSTGMAVHEEIRAAVDAAGESGNERLALLHCVSVYPTPPEKTDLLTVSELRGKFDLTVCFSDHSLSTTLPAAAVALGARIIEKHFTLSRDLPGPDHSVALEPNEFARMAMGCREVAAALGTVRKQITPELRTVRDASLRGLYAAREIPEGQVLKREMVSLLRPASSMRAADLPAILGKIALKNIAAGEALEPGMFREVAE